MRNSDRRTAKYSPDVFISSFGVGRSSAERSLSVLACDLLLAGGGGNVAGCSLSNSRPPSLPLLPPRTHPKIIPTAAVNERSDFVKEECAARELHRLLSF